MDASRATRRKGIGAGEHQCAGTRLDQAHAARTAGAEVPGEGDGLVRIVNLEHPVAQRTVTVDVPIAGEGQRLVAHELPGRIGCGGRCVEGVRNGLRTADCQEGGTVGVLT